MADNQEQPWTIRRVLRWTRDFFTEKGIDSPRLDAELLIADALRLSRIQLYTEHDKPLTPEELALIRERIRRRGRREPVAYIIGKRGFLDLELAVDGRVLVPRPETELLVELAKARLSALTDPSVVDVGTGSGCVALSLARALPTAKITAIDLSPDALAVAAANASALGLTQLEFLQGDLLTPVAERRFEVVVSNPPYIKRGELEGLAPEVSRFEPRLALDGGPDGLDIIRRLIRQAGEVLAPGGVLLFEIGAEQGHQAASLCGDDARFSTAEIHLDHAGLARVIEATRRSTP